MDKRLYIIIIIIVVIILFIYFGPKSLTLSEYDNGSLKCDLGGVNVRSAYWGRGGCQGDVTGKLSDCNGKALCPINAGVSKLGDPCPGDDKTLQVSYNCSKIF